MQFSLSDSSLKLDQVQHLVHLFFLQFKPDVFERALKAVLPVLEAFLNKIIWI
jgi:hypothetical protein